jgi:hypothetical protein
MFAILSGFMGISSPLTERREYTCLPKPLIETYSARPGRAVQGTVLDGLAPWPVAKTRFV